MARVTAVWAAVCLLGLALSACSLAGPTNRSFTPAAKEATSDAEAIKAASKACKTATRDKGIKSVLAIVTRLRPGAVDEDYVACMKAKGYVVAQ